MPDQHTVNPAHQTRQTTPESGLRYDRLFFLREDYVAEIPENPEWLRYSDLVMEFDGDPDPGKEPVHGVGTGDPVYFGRGMEENSMTVTYALQKPVVDTDGNQVDACADSFMRNMAWQTPATHSVYARHNNPTPGRDDPDGCSGQRLYWISRGGKADCSMEPDAEDEEPVPVELEYQFSRIRSFHIWQPEEASGLVVSSTDSRDTDIDVTIESEGGETDGVAETVALDGTTPVATSVEFPDVDAFQLSDTTYGDVELYLNDGTTEAPDAGSRISLLRGSDARSSDTAAQTLDGDLGVPALGTGSFEGTVGLPYEDIQDDRFYFGTFPDDMPLPEIYNITVSVENNYESSPQQGTNAPMIHEENRNVEIEASVIGEMASHSMLQNTYTSEEGDIEWEMSRTKFIMHDAQCIEPPGPGAESEQAFVETEGTWASKGISIENTESES